MTQIVYLNGKFLPIEQATVPVLDRGFVFGDGVYELIPVYSRHPFRLDEHLQRLQNSLDEVRLTNPHTVQEWATMIRELIRQDAHDDQSVYLQITRGVAMRDHPFPKDATPTVFMMTNPLTTPPARLVEEGVKAISAEDNRWGRCNIKSLSLLPNILLRQLAVDAGVNETVLLRDGVLTEGTATNIFAVENGVILAPPKDHHMLPGITYDLVLELALAHGIPTSIGKFEEARIRKADELWLSSSTREILAIVTLDGQPIGNGQPGPLFRQMYAHYQEYKNRIMRAPA